MRIASVVARQLLDCKARPLVEVEITTDTGHVGRGASPTGSSVGVHEAFVLRDGNLAEYNGLSVHRAVAAVTDEIAPVLVGAELDDPRTLDRVMKVWTMPRVQARNLMRLLEDRRGRGTGGLAGQLAVKCRDDFAGGLEELWPRILHLRDGADEEQQRLTCGTRENVTCGQPVGGDQSTPATRNDAQTSAP